MRYTLAGNFLESCDCTVICPCWVDDDPVGGHCTGFILWRITNGRMDGQDVSGCQIVSVSTHSGNRRDSATTSVLYVDPGRHEARARTVVDVLGRAFGGRGGGILAELKEVTGEMIGPYRATIVYDEDAGVTAGAPATGASSWRVQVHEHVTDAERTLRIEATGHPSVFDKEEVEARQGRVAKPLRLEHTALSHELQVRGAVEAQAGDRLTVRVGALPGGNLDVRGRSGMRGTFRYQEPPGRASSGRDSATSSAAATP